MKKNKRGGALSGQWCEFVLSSRARKRAGCILARSSVNGTARKSKMIRGLNRVYGALTRFSPLLQRRASNPRSRLPETKRNRRRAAWAPTFFALMALLSGCAAASRRAPEANPKTADAALQGAVLVTLSPMADVVKNVAGDDLRVLAIVPPDTDPHAFSPTPDDVKKMADARAVFRVGHGVDDWLGEIAQNAGENTPILDLTRGLQFDAVVGEDGHSHDEDAHVWMDPLRVLAITENVCADLQKLQPQSSAAFRRRADDYQKKLRALDAWTKNRVALIPPSRRKLVTSHDALGYFARRYGFAVVGVAVAGGGTDESGANARDIAALIDKISAAKVPAIFAESSSNPALMERLGAEAKVRVIADLRLDALGKPGTPSGTYLGFFRHNVNLIVDALRS